MNLKVPTSNQEEDQILADLVEEFAAQLHEGGSVDWEACARDYPQYVEQLRELVPALEALAGAAGSKIEDLGSKIVNREMRFEDCRSKMDRMECVDPRSSIFHPPSSSGNLGDFRLIREIGKGGMGVVYEAEQVSLSRRVALKILPFAAGLDSRHLQRFKTEAQAAAQLHHTNIVPVFAVGCEQGTHYYAMQYIEGQTLAAIIRKRIEARRSKLEDLGSNSRIGKHGPTTEPSASTIDDQAQPTHSFQANGRSSVLQSRSAEFRNIASLGIQAAQALEYAHQMGVVHRDIKPANLIVDIRGNLWITDFGLARLTNWTTSSCQEVANLHGTGDLLGTLR